MALPVSDSHRLIPDREVDPRRELPAMEQDVLGRWRERDVFAASLRRAGGRTGMGLLRGPADGQRTARAPTTCSRACSRTSIRAFRPCGAIASSARAAGTATACPSRSPWKQKLGIKSKAEIEQYGIGRFNAECRDSVFAFLEEWDRLTERIGFWLDLENAYRTLDESYIESVWWALSEIDERGLLYEGHKVVPYCPRCETTLSSHEVALGYRDVVDPSVFLKLPVLGGVERLLVWTTTPWTLPGNVAVAVSPTASYALVRAGGETYLLAEDRVEAVLGEQSEVLERMSGTELAERYRSYEGPIFDMGEPGAFPILTDEFVTTGDGTGIVHLAPAFGEEDYRVAGASELVAFDPTRSGTLPNPVRPDGTFDETVRSYRGRSYAGRQVKDEDVTSELIEDLRERGLLLKVQDYEHAYPHCWRSGNALIYYAKPSWYIATSTLRDELLAANETVDWHPPHVKHGRFGDWLQNNVDWALSRERYWGTPLPVWRCAAGHHRLIGSFGELQELSGRTLEDHHRPYVDEVLFACPEEGCGEQMRRVPEVIDVWFDSGAMPFAQHHFPFEGQTEMAQFPADFICEAQDQTRGWFYSLLAISILLGRGAPYRNVVCLGLILDEEGQKMSKSKGNTVEPWEVLDTYGADAFRWYFFTSKQPWDGYRFSADTIGEGVRLFLKQLWSTYYFYALYARAAAVQLEGAGEGAEQDLDRWALSRTAGTVELVAERLDAYDATTAGRAIAELLDDLSNWYVRRSRRRFWDADPAAFRTLRTCLLAVVRMLAPFCPFVTDEIYDNLDGELPSVHLCDFPSPAEVGRRDEELERAMALARETVRLGLGARGKAKIKIRQPLREAAVVAEGREREAIERLVEVVREELNVEQVRFVAAAEELGSYEIKANYRTLGPKFGKDMPRAAEAVAALDPAHVARRLREGGEIGITVGGRDHGLGADDLILTMRAPEGYSVEREGAHAVALDLEIDEHLREAGRAREIVHAVQNARKSAGLAVEDRISLALGGDPAHLAAAEAHRDYLAGETLAVELSIGDGEGALAYAETAKVEDLELRIALSRVG